MPHSPDSFGFTVLELIAATLPLFFGTALLWAGFSITRFLARLVRPARPPAFVALHIAAVWSVGIASGLCGLALVVHGIALATN
jgi:uncharacterized membrane protein